MASYKDLAELAGFTSRIYVLLQVLHSLDRGQYQSVRPASLSLQRQLTCPASCRALRTSLPGSLSTTWAT